MHISRAKSGVASVATEVDRRAMGIVRRKTRAAWIPGATDSRQRRAASVDGGTRMLGITIDRAGTHDA